MKLTTIIANGDTAVARAEGDELVVLPHRSLSELLRKPTWRDDAAAAGPHLPAAEAQLATLLAPGKIFCAGLNYRAHIRETGREEPKWPSLFAKFADVLTAPHADIHAPSASQRVDWEVELGVVIGSSASNVTPDEALGHVAGYTIVNDISMRDWQNRTTQWLQGKVFEASTPVGPCLVTPDEIDHAADLRITCSVNGDIKQDGRTSDLLFTVPYLISYISQFTTLRPGDLIATGTPSGVGNARDPQEYLHPGDTLESEIEGIGRLVNRIV